MRRYRQLKRLFISVCMSLVVVIAMAANAKIVSSFDDLTYYDRFINYLATPPIMIVDWVLGEGFILDRIWIYLWASLIFYTALIWSVISLWNRIHNKKLPTE